MTEEEIKAILAAKEEAEKRVSEAETAASAARAEADKFRGDLEGVVNELKEERQKKNEALSKLNINGNPPDVTTLVESVLQEKESARRKAELEQAINEFKNSKPEFAKDPSGLLFDKFKQSLSRFNFSDISSREEAKKMLDKVYAFENFKGSSDDPAHDGTPSGVESVPGDSNPIPRGLDGVIETARIDKEKFVKLQSKYPDALNGLGI